LGDHGKYNVKAKRRGLFGVYTFKPILRYDSQGIAAHDYCISDLWGKNQEDA